MSRSAYDDLSADRTAVSLKSDTGVPPWTAVDTRYMRHDLLTRQVKPLSIAFGLSPSSFFPGPAIDFFALESQEVAHTSVGQRMFILNTLGPLHDSCSRGLTFRI